MDARDVADAVARQSYGRLVSILASRTRDVAGAEDALSEAFAAALADWPRSGVPDRPEAWLLAVARRRWIDATRRHRTAEDAASHLRLLAEEIESAEATPGDLPDERLALMFACAHPALDPGIRAPLILQTLLGFDAVAIGSAFLVSPATMGQRLVRAKRKIRDAGIPFAVPEGDELGARLDAVLSAIYACFAEGWAAVDGTDLRRRDLAEEAIWLGRLVVARLSDAAEAAGLLSLMLHAHARREARRDAAGDFVPLAEQDPKVWDTALLEEAEALLVHASALEGVGRYQLEAAIQSAHAGRRFGQPVDWEAIAAIYDALAAMTGSPVVAVNRAVAVAEVQGAEAGLEALAAVADETRLADYQPYWAARAELLARAGRSAEADEAFRRASGLERDPGVQRFLERRRAALRGAVA